MPPITLTRPKKILALLEGGDRRSVGRADEVAALVSRNPKLFPQLLAGLWSDDAVVRMRAADAAEKVTRTAPQLLQRYKEELLGLLAESALRPVQKRVRQSSRQSVHKIARQSVEQTGQQPIQSRERGAPGRIQSHREPSRNSAEEPIEEPLQQPIQQEVRWHLAVMIPRLKLTAAEAQHVASHLTAYLDDRSSIVKTFALQGLWDLAQQHPSVRPLVTELLQSAVRTGTAAMRARARKLLGHSRREERFKL